MAADPDNPNEFKSKFKVNTRSWLAYSIASSAINIGLDEDNQVLITLDNSRGTRTPGYLCVPLENLPELITDLQMLYTANIHKLK